MVCFFFFLIFLSKIKNNKKKTDLHSCVRTRDGSFLAIPVIGLGSNDDDKKYEDENEGVLIVFLDYHGRNPNQFRGVIFPEELMQRCDRHHMKHGHRGSRLMDCDSCFFKDRNGRSSDIHPEFIEDVLRGHSDVLGLK